MKENSIMKTRKVLEVMTGKDIGYIYSDVFSLLSESQIKKLKISVVRELSIKQGRITDRYEDSMYVAGANKGTSKKAMQNISRACIKAQMLSEKQQQREIEYSNRWLDSQPDCSVGRASTALLSILYKKHNY